MKYGTRKLSSRRGETLVEILVAILIIALSAGLFASMYMAAMGINSSAREQDRLFYDAVDRLEEMIVAGDDESVKDTVHYTPRKAEGDTSEPPLMGNTGDVAVDVFTQDGMTVYKESGGTP